MKNRYFANNYILNKSSNLTTLLYTDASYNYYLLHSKVCFYQIDFFFFKIQISLPNFVFFGAKSPRATQRSVSQENVLKKRLNIRRLFFANATAQIILSLLLNTMVLKITKFEFNVTLLYGYGKKKVVTP